MSDDAYTDPLTATPCDAAVVVFCVHRPFTVALTPRAARESAARLVLAAQIVERTQSQADDRPGRDGL